MVGELTPGSFQRSGLVKGRATPKQKIQSLRGGEGSGQTPIASGLVSTGPGISWTGGLEWWQRHGINNVTV